MNRGTTTFHGNASQLENGVTTTVLKPIQVSETYLAITPVNGIVTINLNLATVFNLTLNANVTSFVIINNAINKLNPFTLFVLQDSIGSRTVSWTFTGKTLKWPAGIAPTLTATASKEDIFSFMSKDGGATYYGFTGGQSY